MPVEMKECRVKAQRNYYGASETSETYVKDKAKSQRKDGCDGKMRVERGF